MHFINRIVCFFYTEYCGSVVIVVAQKKKKQQHFFFCQYQNPIKLSPKYHVHIHTITITYFSHWALSIHIRLFSLLVRRHLFQIIFNVQLIHNFFFFLLRILVNFYRHSPKFLVIAFENWLESWNKNQPMRKKNKTLLFSLGMNSSWCMRLHTVYLFNTHS